VWVVLLLANDLSFNTNTGAISGVPIVASDSVTYVITATSFFTYNEDTATVVIAVGIGDINLALGVNLPPSALFILSVGCTSIGEFTISVTIDCIASNSVDAV
jgi:hypothetical protein